MKLTTQKPQAEEQPVVLSLEDAGYPEGSFDVVARKGGRSQYTLRFDSDGTIERYEDIDPKLGFQLDDRGRVQVGAG